MIPDFEFKFRFKNVDFSLDALVDRREKFEASWVRSLGHQLVELPELSIVFSDVGDYLNSLSVVFNG